MRIFPRTKIASTTKMMVQTVGLHKGVARVLQPMLLVDRMCCLRTHRSTKEKVAFRTTGAGRTRRRAEEHRRSAVHSRHQHSTAEVSTATPMHGQARDRRHRGSMPNAATASSSSQRHGRAQIEFDRGEMQEGHVIDCDAGHAVDRRQREARPMSSVPRREYETPDVRAEHYRLDSRYRYAAYRQRHDDFYESGIGRHDVRRSTQYGEADDRYEAVLARYGREPHADSKALPAIDNAGESGMPKSRGIRYMKPDKFAGNSSVETFLIQFGVCADYNGWDDTDRATQLKCCLSGMASQLLWDSGMLGELSDADLVDKLKARFVAAGLQERFAAELRSRRRRHGEPISELHADIKRLMALAYPDAAHSKLGQVIARDHLITSLNDRELELKVRTVIPKIWSRHAKQLFV